MRNDHQQHRGGPQRGGRGPQGPRGHQQPGRRNAQPPQSGQGYYNPDREGWGARGDQGPEDWERRDEEMDRGQYTAPLGHGDDTDWHDDESFGGEFIGDDANRFPTRGSEAGSRDYGMGGYGTHGGAQAGQWGTQGSRGVGAYGGQGLGGGPGGYYGQGFGQRQGGSIGGPSSGGMGWRGEPSWQGGQHFGGGQPQHGPQQGSAQRFERGPKGYKRSDDRIKEEVSDRIYQLQHVDSSDVEVEVKEGVVTLTGTIPNRIMKWQLENLVESVGGVSDVNNQLRIRKHGFMQELQSTAQSAMNALKPGDGNKDSSDERNLRRQDPGSMTKK